MPTPISNQKFNEWIKEVAELAEINEIETMTSTVGGKLETTPFFKYELVVSHTGRRSFATNMYKKGLSTLTIMSITGHKTEKNFLKYIKVSQEEHANIMAEQWKTLFKEYYNK